MHLERITIARLLETTPSNIRGMHQNQGIIYVKLWNTKAEEGIPIQKYNDFLEEQAKQHSKSGKGGTKGVSITLMIIGALVMITGWTMDTTVSTSFGQRVHNVGLMNEQNQRTQLGGIVFIAGVVLYSLDKRSGSS